MVFLLIMGKSCLGLELLLSGQKRSPIPPARITGMIFTEQAPV
jgi:hypothetical protein